MCFQSHPTPTPNSPQWFRMADWDSTGSLTKENIRDVLKATCDVDERKLKSLVDREWAGWAGVSGGVTEEELPKVLSFIRANVPRKAVKGECPHITTHKQGWFEYWDEDNSGELDKDEVARALIKTFERGTHGGRVRDIQHGVDSVWCLFDNTGSNTVTKREFLARDGLADTIIAFLQADSSFSAAEAREMELSSPTGGPATPAGRGFSDPSTDTTPPLPQQRGGGYGGGSAAAATATGVRGRQPGARRHSSPPQSGGGGSSRSSHSGGGWRCARCTFDNPAPTPACAVCTARNPARPRASAAASPSSPSTAAAPPATPPPQNPNYMPAGGVPRGSPAGSVSSAAPGASSPFSPVEYRRASPGLSRTTGSLGALGVPAQGGSLHRTRSGPSHSTRFCVVCGTVGTAGQARRSGWKCNECVGKPHNFRIHQHST